MRVRDEKYFLFIKAEDSPPIPYPAFGRWG